MIAEKAKENQIASGGAVHQKSDKAPINTTKELARVANVSHDTLHKVETIEKKATPEVKQKVRSGEISINKAYQIYIALREDTESAKVLLYGHAVKILH